MLKAAGTNLMQLPLIERRHRLEDVLLDLHPCLQLILQTSDPDLASEWLGEVPGLEGVVAKRADGRYRPGRREWIKVKRRRTADCAVVGVAGDESAPMLVLALRHLDGEMRLCGVTRVPKELTDPLEQLIRRAGPPEGPIRSRWQKQEIAQWRRVPPEMVCEVVFSNVDFLVVGKVEFRGNSSERLLVTGRKRALPASIGTGPVGVEEDDLRLESEQLGVQYLLVVGQRTAPLALSLYLLLEQLRHRLAASGQFVAYSPGPNPNPDVERELRRWLAVHPRANASAGFRAGWARLARFVGPKLREWEARWWHMAREGDRVRARLGVALR